MVRTPADCHGLVALYRPALLPAPAQARLEAVQSAPEPAVLGTIKPRGWRVSWPTYSRGGVTLRLVSMQDVAMRADRDAGGETRSQGGTAVARGARL